MLDTNKLSLEMKAMINGTDDNKRYPDISKDANYEDLEETSRVDFELFKTMVDYAKSKTVNRIMYRNCLPKWETISRVDYGTLSYFDKRYWDVCKKTYPEYPWIID